MNIKLLDIVKLETDIPGNGLQRGDIGAVVELYEDSAVEVEFVTAGGKTQALLTLEGSQFSPLGPQDMLAARTLNAA